MNSFERRSLFDQPTAEKVSAKPSVKKLAEKGLLAIIGVMLLFVLGSVLFSGNRQPVEAEPDKAQQIAELNQQKAEMQVKLATAKENIERLTLELAGEEAQAAQLRANIRSIEERINAKINEGLSAAFKAVQYRIIDPNSVQANITGDLGK